MMDGGSAVMDHHHRFGHFSSLSILMNNIIGPGITQLPRFFQDCGWVLTTLTILVTGVGTAVAGVYLCEAVRLIRGNKDFRLRIEYSSVVKHYFSNRCVWHDIALAHSPKWSPAAAAARESLLASPTTCKKRWKKHFVVLDTHALFRMRVSTDELVHCSRILTDIHTLAVTRLPFRTSPYHPASLFLCV